MSTAPIETSFKLPTPEDEQGVWLWDSIHCPRPLPALAAEFFGRFSKRGPGHPAKFVNGYAFMSAAGSGPSPDAPSHLSGKEAWEQHYLPRLSAICEELVKRDYRALPATELAAQVPAVIDRAVDALVDTMLALTGVDGPTNALADFCEAKAGIERGTMLAQTMLGGSVNDSVGVGEKIASLAAIAGESPNVAVCLRAGDFERLDRLPEAAPFRAAFNDFLATHGQAVQMWGEIHLPTWAEDPQTPLRMVAAYLRDDNLTARAHSRTTARRDDTVAEFEAGLSEDERAEFRRLLAEASETIPVMEARARWQLICAATTRPAIMALGDKLHASGAIDQPEDVFQLRVDELGAVAAEELDARELIQRRKAELETWAKLTPPPMLGQRLPRSVIASFPMLRRFFGIGVEESATAEVVKGFGASRGVVTGRARVIADLADADGLVEGDILVCPSTSPPWTPYFAIVAAVVTNGGGVLCHAAIEAREYGIPAVVGTRDGTHRIPDGARITVDGEQGIVTIE